MGNDSKLDEAAGQWCATKSHKKSPAVLSSHIVFWPGKEHNLFLPAPLRLAQKDT